MNCPNCGMRETTIGDKYVCGSWLGGQRKISHVSEACREIARLKAEVAQKDAEIARLRTGLVRYGECECDCRGNLSETAVCDCGFVNLVTAAVRGEE